jgi:Fic family protein
MPITNADDRDRCIVRSLMEEAITSSQLEGAPTTRKDALDLLRSGRRPRDHGERMILNNYLAMQAIRDMGRTALTPDEIFNLHRVLTEGTLDNPDAAGRLQRPNEKRVRVMDNRDGTVLHEPPAAQELPRRLETLCRFANGDDGASGFVHPDLRAILLHFGPCLRPFVRGWQWPGSARFFTGRCCARGTGSSNTSPSRVCYARSRHDMRGRFNTRKLTTMI